MHIVSLHFFTKVILVQIYILHAGRREGEEVALPGVL